jgi:hypothetical protein
MVLIMSIVTYPLDKGPEMAKRYIEALKKFPPDRSLSKTLTIGVKATKDGIKVIGVSDIKKGKYEEALLRIVKTNQEYVDVEGFSYELETYLDIAEAMPIVGQTAPEDR